MTGNFARPSAVKIDCNRDLPHTGVDAFCPSLVSGY